MIISKFEKRYLEVSCGCSFASGKGGAGSEPLSRGQAPVTTAALLSELRVSKLSFELGAHLNKIDINSVPFFPRCFVCLHDNRAKCSTPYFFLLSNFQRTYSYFMRRGSLKLLSYNRMIFLFRLERGARCLSAWYVTGRSGFPFWAGSEMRGRNQREKRNQSSVFLLNNGLQTGRPEGQGRPR